MKNHCKNANLRAEVAFNVLFHILDPHHCNAFDVLLHTTTHQRTTKEAEEKAFSLHN
jgi:hypothetical protein